MEGHRTDEKAGRPLLGFQVEPPRPLRWGLLRRGLLALRLELLHRLGEGGLQALRERWGTQSDGGEWLQKRCLFRFWPLRALLFRFQSPLLFDFLGQFGSEFVQSLLAISPCFRHPRGLFFLFPVQGGGGEVVEMLREIERRQFALALQ